MKGVGLANSWPFGIIPFVFLFFSDELLLYRKGTFMIRALRLKDLPPYLFTAIDEMKIDAIQQGEEIIDLGMGNPDRPTPDFVVDRLVESAREAKNHRYSASRGITRLREAAAALYKRRFDVDVDPGSEVVSISGIKEGITQVALSVLNNGDAALVPGPTYPIHSFGVVIAGGHLVRVPLHPLEDFFEALAEVQRHTWPRAKMLILCFPHNPTTTVVPLEFFERAVEFANREGIVILHDFAYADITYDGLSAPSILQVPGAKEVAVELFSLSKSYRMAGWRIGFAVGNSEVIEVLASLKSYMDYGIFQPIQIAGIMALEEGDSFVKENRAMYQRRRDTLISALAEIGWNVPVPRGTIYLWAPIPEPFREIGSLKFSKRLLAETSVVVAPGIGFGPGGEGYVRLALVESEDRIRRAVKKIGDFLDKGREA